MAISSLLQFGQKDADDKWQLSKQYNVVDCHLHFMRHYNHFRPDTDARCEKVEVVVEAPGKDDLTLVGWYVNNEVAKIRRVFGCPLLFPRGGVPYKYSAQTLLPVVDRCREYNSQRYFIQEPLCLR